MGKHIKGKPWYFAFVVISFLVSNICAQVIQYYFNEELIYEILSKQFTLSRILPWGFAGVTLFICMVVYIIQIKRRRQMLSDEKKAKLNSVITKATDEDEYIESLQAFKYYIKNIDKKKYVKLCYLSGAASEGIEINTILQTYYYFTYPIYKKIKLVSSHYDDYIEATDPVKREDAHTAFLESGQELCNNLLNSLNSIKTIDEIGDFHCEMYRVLARLLPAISKEAFERYLKDEQIEMALIKRKKTGILGSVILNDLYIFRNQNSISKSDRIYFTFPYDRKDNIIMLASISGSCFPSDKEGVIEEYCKRVSSNTCA